MEKIKSIIRLHKEGKTVNEIVKLVFSRTTANIQIKEYKDAENMLKSAAQTLECAQNTYNIALDRFLHLSPVTKIEYYENTL